jgi:hypothetical protein
MTSWQTQKGYALLGKLAGIEADGRVKVKTHKQPVRQLSLRLIVITFVGA